MDRNQAIDLFNKIHSELDQIGDCNWHIETGGVVCKRDGTVKMTFSIRDQNYKEIAKKFKHYIKENYPNVVRISQSNQMETYRPEYKFIVTM